MLQSRLKMIWRNDLQRLIETLSIDNELSEYTHVCARTHARTHTHTHTHTNTHKHSAVNVISNNNYALRSITFMTIFNHTR